jgi:hypothetical protein
MKREELIAALLLGCMGVGIAAVEFSEIKRNPLAEKAFSVSLILGVIFVLILLLYIAYAKRFRSHAQRNRTAIGEKRMVRWSVIGASFSGLILFLFTSLTGLPASVFISVLSGMLSGFMISLSLAVIVKLSLATLNIKSSL